jgi:type I site-specific restriction endonuclease
MKPEEKSRQQIDRQLEQAGWTVQDHREINISAGLGVAVREFPLTTGDADYMLYGWIPEKWRLHLGLDSIASDPCVTQYA